MTPRFQLTAPKIKLSENDVREACLDLLARLNWKTIRIHNGKFKTWDGRPQTHGELGMPDYVCLHGEFMPFFMETKRPGGQLSKVQLIKIGQLECGYHLRVAVIDSVERLVNWLRENGRYPP